MNQRLSLAITVALCAVTPSPALGRAPEIIATGIGPEWVTAVGRNIYFSARDAAHGRELWVTNGTSSGTHIVIDLFVGTSDSHPKELIDQGDYVWFVANRGGTSPGPSPVVDYEVWRSDGTPEGTFSVTSLTPQINDYRAREIELSADRRFWSSRNQLWVNSGMASTSSRLLPLSNGLSVRELTDAEGTLYFFLGTRDLWKSNGTMAGTGLVQAFSGSSTYLDRAFAVGTRLFFRRGGELWTSDGTSAGTVMLLPGAGQPRDPRNLAAFGDLLLFSMFDSTHGREPWISDGTTEGTQLLADLVPGPADSNPDFFTTVGGTIYFAAHDGATGLKLWKSNGSPNDATYLTDVAFQSNGEPFPANMIRAPLDDGVLLVTLTTSRGAELTWVRASGDLTLLPEVIPGPADGDMRDLVRIGLVLYFVADSETEQNALWRLDMADVGFIPQMVNCYAGPQATPTPSDPEHLKECQLSFDADADDDVDLMDWAAFTLRVSATP